MMVGFPRTIAASWDTVGASLILPVTAEPGAIARLRVLADFADERLTESLTLRLSATDGSSAEVTIALPEVRRETIDPFDIAWGLAMWSTIDLALPNGTSALTVEVVGPSAGSMQILSLDALAQPRPSQSTACGAVPPEGAWSRMLNRVPRCPDQPKIGNSTWTLSDPNDLSVPLPGCYISSFRTEARDGVHV